MTEHTIHDRRIADRRQALSDALEAWTGTERRIAQRRAYDSARITHWLNRYHAARAAHETE